MTLRLNGSTSGYTEITSPAVGGNSTAGIVLPAGSTTDRPATGEEGQVRFNTTTGRLEFWSTTSDTPQWRNVSDGPLNVVSVRYLVIGGGGGGGGYIQAAGGGAGGYRTNFGTGNISGGNSAVEADLNLQPGTAYTVTVGAGGAGGGSVASTSWGSRGSDSVFATITSLGGGGGGLYSGIMPPTSQLPVGSGGGAPNVGSTAQIIGQSGTTGQGSDGGSKLLASHSANYPGMGGGGAGAPGESRSATGEQERDGGAGLASTITGTSVTRAGGGGGGIYWNGGPGGSGGAGGGGQGASDQAGGAGPAGDPGVANTGGGGGGAGGPTTGTGGAGGSGVVILRIPNTFSATFTGVTASAAAAVGSDRVYTVTAGTGTVTFTKD